MKKISGICSNAAGHWVGDGFPVRSLFSYNALGPRAISPFLLLDYAGPAEFTPASKPRGVGQHPHRGFETVTLVYDGEVAHRDSTGQGGVIGPGDVQWMTAAGGILHQEFHSDAFTRTGGTLRMIQLWVNLPARHKMGAPGYQTILASDIPSAVLPDGAGRIRVIAGDYADRKGPARTFTPINLWDLSLAGRAQVELPVPDGHTTALVVLGGEILVNGAETAREAQAVLFDRDGDGIALEATMPSAALLLSGEPIDEPVVGHGPFVMNTTDEIRQAVADFESGRFGAIAHQRRADHIPERGEA